MLKYVTPMLPLSVGDPNPCPMSDSLGLHDSIAPNDISIGSAVFAQLTFVTNRQTDRPRYNGSNRPHLVLCIALLPNS